MESKEHLYIFSEKINQRLVYTANEMIRRRIGLDFYLTNDPSSFQNHQGPKLNYSTVDWEDVPQMVPAKLLFEKRIQEQELDISKDGFLRLYSAKHQAIGFDAFSAAFYFLSRYEEYLPHRQDEHDRFPASESLVVKHQCEKIPLVEVYANVLGEWLKDAYPTLQPDYGKASIQVTVDVDQLFVMKAKGLTRSILGTAASVLNGSVGKRLAVMTGKDPDPNEVYDRIISACQRKNIKPLFFFQVGENSRFDINNPPHLAAVKERINEISIEADVGIHPSYFSSEKSEMLPTELDRLRQILSYSIKSSRQHFLKYRIPETFRQLSELGIEREYSLGFSDRNGFRASTCKPFRFYDLPKEEVLELTMFPLSMMDIVSVKIFHDHTQALLELIELKNTVQRYGGVMITTWHPEVLNGLKGPYDSMLLFDQFLEDV